MRSNLRQQLLDAVRGRAEAEADVEARRGPHTDGPSCLGSGHFMPAGVAWPDPAPPGTYWCDWCGYLVRGVA